MASPPPADVLPPSRPAPAPQPAQPAAPDMTLAAADVESVGGGGGEGSPPAAQLVQGKAKARTGPLRLLDLPVDILKEIVHHLPHTNDLTALALCHSALHRLAIPCIYARFDIVWPDESTHSDSRSGVDALTYGLATLVMADDAFPHQARRIHNPQGPHAYSQSSPISSTQYPLTRRRLGNYYAQFTKKFSLGNGPAAWVHEYLISKEGGKMLGTLVALAIARMVNLESFVWDMPTGVLRDVWLALSSLADRTDGEDCRLERVWVRWHDNSLDAPTPPPAPPILTNVHAATTQPSGVGANHTPVAASAPFPTPATSAIERVEHPSFSVLPALRSLSVLDIDELPYLDEMSILIARSAKRLRELRVGIATHAQNRDWVSAWEGDGIQQVDYSTTSTAASAIGEKRLGGVLGILVGRVHNMRQSEERPGSSSGAQAAELASTVIAGATAAKLGSPGSAPEADVPGREPEGEQQEGDVEVSSTIASNGDAAVDSLEQVDGAEAGEPQLSSSLDEPFTAQPATLFAPNTDTPKPKDSVAPASPGPKLDGKLKLEILELERVPLSVSVLSKALDWPMLTTLTLLNCTNHEQLWKHLRRTYTPCPPSASGSSPSSKAYKAGYSLRTSYALNLKKVHTNAVSPSLISFLKETLAPNTLEVLFLQESSAFASTVTVDAIYRGPLRRHRSSLRKIMIDSSGKGADGQVMNGSRWRRWMVNREIISFMTSGRMSSLRELAVSVDYKDWVRLSPLPPLYSSSLSFGHGEAIADVE